MPRRPTKDKKEEGNIDEDGPSNTSQEDMSAIGNAIVDGGVLGGISTVSSTSASALPPVPADEEEEEEEDMGMEEVGAESGDEEYGTKKKRKKVKTKVKPRTSKTKKRSRPMPSDSDNTPPPQRRKLPAAIANNRWKATLVGNMVYPQTHFGPFGYDFEKGQYPLERPNMLGVLVCPVRRPTVIERWSPYEIACFEAGITLYGKHFHTLQKIIKTKSTCEIIEFYYIWKKTSHYKIWKKAYEDEDAEASENEDLSDNEDGGNGGVDAEQVNA